MTGRTALPELFQQVLVHARAAVSRAGLPDRTSAIPRSTAANPRHQTAPP
ncbi:hypothetical protein [Kitasatospora sp. NPDC091276]